MSKKIKKNMIINKKLIVINRKAIQIENDFLGHTIAASINADAWDQFS